MNFLTFVSLGYAGAICKYRVIRVYCRGVYDFVWSTMCWFNVDLNYVTSPSYYSFDFVLLQHSTCIYYVIFVMLILFCVCK